jgi:hypothetical protein
MDIPRDAAVVANDLEAATFSKRKAPEFRVAAKGGRKIEKGLRISA